MENKITYPAKSIQSASVNEFKSIDFINSSTINNDHSSLIEEEEEDNAFSFSFVSLGILFIAFLLSE